MSRNKYIRLMVDIVVFTMGTVLTKVVQFLLMPLYTTYMTTEAYGIAELTNNMSELLFPIVTLCIYEAAFRFVVGSKFTSEEIITSSVKVLSFSLLVGAMFLLLSNIFVQYKYAEYLYLILCTYSFRMLIAYYVRGKGYTKLFATSGIINAIFLAIFSVIFLVVFRLDIDGYLLAIAFSYFSAMLYLFIGGKLYKEIKFGIYTGKVTRELLKYSTPLIIYNVGYWLTTMTGRYILFWNTDASTAGVYAAVIKITAVVNMLQQAFYAAFQLNTSREFESIDKEVYYSNILKLYATCVLVIGSIILCFSPLLARFTLKNEFYFARIYLPLVLFTAILDCLFCFYKTMYTTYKFTKRAVPSMLVGAIINIVVCLATVKNLGIWGICIASLLCYSSQAVYRIFDVKKFVKIKSDWKMICINLCILLLQMIILSIDKVFYNIIACLLAIICLLINMFKYKIEVRKVFDFIYFRLKKTID